MSLWAAFVNGKPWTLASCAFGFALSGLSGWHWTFPAFFAVLLLLNLASFDYQRRHGWPLPDEDDE